jgi:hypothetical protein
MDLPWGPPHLVQNCSCKAIFAVEIRQDQIDLGPVELARSLPENVMQAYLTFCDDHEASGHELGELLVAAFAKLGSGPV